MAKSTVSRRSSKSQSLKPTPDFPLTAHPTGRWCKKIKGRIHYFGPIDDPEGARAKLDHEFPYLKRGETPPPIDGPEGDTLGDLCNKFLNNKRRRLESGELSQRSFNDYLATCKKLCKHIGESRKLASLRADDFERYREALSKRLSIVSMKNELNRARILIKFSDDAIKTGDALKTPEARLLRKARNEAGQRMFKACELRHILDALEGKPVDAIDPKTGEPERTTLTPDPALRAMVLLGVQCGYGNTDCASLPQSAIDFESGWIDFPRPKTHVRRRSPLWGETIDALHDAIKARKPAKRSADSELVFLTQKGRPWVRIQAARQQTTVGSTKKIAVDALSQRFAKLLKRLGINGRKGLNFYALRHVFETIGGESKDQVAVNALMGHVDNTMAGEYRETISDERLLSVVATIHDWLF